MNISSFFILQPCCEYNNSINNVASASWLNLMFPNAPRTSPTLPSVSLKLDIFEIFMPIFPPYVNVGFFSWVKTDAGASVFFTDFVVFFV
ncbi:hypothetical protein SDC9_179124 [bioreactor metagenome]|uniref:Uncharacterized protein n=1 Tax=bioreactor metagenome TaxID=1076179 RepID=A0A645GZ06_9ZZZZ